MIEHAATSRKLREFSATGPADALEFILFEHLKHREMCSALDSLAESRSYDAAQIAKLADFIRVDLTMHILDEQDLFDLLRARCDPEDQIEAALDRFDREHEDDRDLSAQVRIFLYTASATATPLGEIPGAIAAVRAFAQSQRRHMMLENAVLIPLARRRFSADDVTTLGKRFAERRRVRDTTRA